MRYSILITALNLFLITNCFSQSTPTPPETIVTYTNTVSNSSTVSSDNEKENSSVSIKNNNTIYKLTAKFHPNKVDKLKKILIDNLGMFNSNTTDGSFTWKKNKHGEKTYDCILTNTTLRLYVHKDLLNVSKVDELVHLGNQLKDLISNTNSSKEREKQAEKALKMAKRRLALAERELALAKRQINNN